MLSDLVLERFRAPTIAPELHLVGKPHEHGGYRFAFSVDGEWFSYVSIETSLSEALAELAVELESARERSAAAND